MEFLGTLGHNYIGHTYIVPCSSLWKFVGTHDPAVVHIRVDMCIDTRMDMCSDVRADACIEMCTDMCVHALDICIDMCICTGAHSLSAVAITM